MEITVNEFWLIYDEPGIKKINIIPKYIDTDIYLYENYNFDKLYWCFKNIC